MSPHRTRTRHRRRVSALAGLALLASAALAQESDTAERWHRWDAPWRATSLDVAVDRSGEATVAALGVDEARTAVLSPAAVERLAQAVPMPEVEHVAVGAGAGAGRTLLAGGTALRLGVPGVAPLDQRGYQLAPAVAARATAGGWSAPDEGPPVPPAAGSGGIEEIDVALDARGDGVAAWRTICDVYAATVSRGVWTSARRLTRGCVRHDQIDAAAGAGGVAVSWRTVVRSDNVGSVHAAAGTARAGLGAPIRLSPARRRVQEPVVAVGPRGRAVVAWQQGLRTAAIVVRVRAGGRWGAAHRVSGVIRDVPTGLSSYSHDVGMDARGRALLAWDARTVVRTASLGGTARTFGRSRPAPGSVTRIRRGVESAADHVRVAVGADGTAVLAWSVNVPGTLHDQPLRASVVTPGNAARRPAALGRDRRRPGRRGGPRRAPRGRLDRLPERPRRPDPRLRRAPAPRIRSSAEAATRSRGRSAPRRAAGASPGARARRRRGRAPPWRDARRRP